MSKTLDIMTMVLYHPAMHTTSGERRSTSDVARDRALLRDIAPGLVALVVTQGSLVVLDPDGTASGWNVVWSLLPMIPAAWLVWAQLRSLKRADEYQRVVQLEALAIGFGAVTMLALLGGLLDAAGIGDPRQSLQVTFIAGILVWIGALAVKTSRVR
jgi:hypothetical protein